GEGIPEGLVLRRNDARSVRNVLDPSDLEIRTRENPMEPRVRTRPALGNFPGLFPGEEKEVGQGNEKPPNRVDVKRYVEEQRANDDHAACFRNAGARRRVACWLTHRRDLARRMCGNQTCAQWLRATAASWL